ncbi:unnamed protein product [Brachionus calyciflorus]|uniref:Uncharacterized protein n=1 Tax=Brachionus calyciflorus TaxID=104777 RepID=A0A813P406_9BILA|nr:unnamed protein product [Brachionus calyciflorus]
MFSWGNGEDLQLCMSARKYANIRTFVMPSDHSNPEVNGFTQDYFDLSFKGDTTKGKAADERSFVIMEQFKRGDRHMEPYLRNETTLMIFAENKKDVQVQLKILKILNITSIDTVVAIYNNKEDDIKDEELEQIYKFKYLKDFMIGREFNSNISFLSKAAEAIYHFDTAVQETQSTALLIIGS